MNTRKWRDLPQLSNQHLLNALRYMERRDEVLRYRALLFEARRRGIFREASPLRAA